MNNTSRIFQGKDDFTVREVIKEARNEKSTVIAGKEEKKVIRKVQLDPIKK